MRTTVNIDDELLAKARDYTGEKEKTKLLHLGLEALIQREVAKRLVALGGSMPDLELPQRRRSSEKRR
jgi:Arc/MetJ family transcription regulator